MGRTAPPFAIPGPPGSSLFLRSPSSPRHYFFFLFLSRHSLPSSQRSSPFSISLSAQMYTRVLFSFHSTHRYLVLQPAVTLSLRPQSSFIPKSLVFLSVYSALYTYASYHRECIPDISIPSVMLYQCDNTLSFAHVCVCVRSMSLPLFQQTGTRKCLPILLPTEVRSR